MGFMENAFEYAPCGNLLGDTEGEWGTGSVVMGYLFPVPTGPSTLLVVGFVSSESSTLLGLPMSLILLVVFSSLSYTEVINRRGS